MTKEEIQNKLDQVNNDIDSLCENKAELEKQLVEASLPKLKHGDVVCNEGYYYVWIRGIGGEMSYFGQYGKLASKGAADCYYEKNRAQIVGNIFEGYQLPVG